MSIIFIFLTILILESILSIDNAAVLAVVVNKALDNPVQRKKAMTYGILGAYLFRGVSLLAVGWILYNPMFGIWAKLLGGFYLLKLAYTYFWGKQESDVNTSWASRIGKFFGLSVFWQTVLAVELLDIAFSVDNLLAVVSLTENMYAIITAVFLGILIMRFVAQKFSTLLHKYPKLESSAFVVIFALGAKLIVSGLCDWLPILMPLKAILDTHTFDIVFSCITMLIFFLPVIIRYRK